ncbi:MAG: hypothetical protein FD177_2099 [Desulfovibrionaceae bacterium]|nr:MAG: hypothetical protein FD177_2099 [Desulfovibrionaceae bacterium]
MKQAALGCVKIVIFRVYVLDSPGMLAYEQGHLDAA